MSTFHYDFTSSSSSLAVSGTVEWDATRSQHKATIIAQSSPDIRFEAWSDNAPTATLLCCAKWMGRELMPLIIE